MPRAPSIALPRTSDSSFSGDAILGAIVCELLFRQYPDYLEGDLTRLKSIVVSRQTCAKLSEALGMQEFLILARA